MLAVRFLLASYLLASRCFCRSSCTPRIYTRLQAL
nr:MAG TPA: hypothetical protein [Caudoviricetes sp.]